MNRNREASTGRAWHGTLDRSLTLPRLLSSDSPHSLAAVSILDSMSSRPSNLAAARPISEGPTSAPWFHL